MNVSNHVLRDTIGTFNNIVHSISVDDTKALSKLVAVDDTVY